MSKLFAKSFTKIWNKVSVKDKLLVIKERQDLDNDNIGLDFFSGIYWCYLMYNFHFECLKVILHDKDLQCYRSAIKTEIVKILLSWVLSKNQEWSKQINNFMNEALISREERKQIENELFFACEETV